jgi:hypothetical protein
MSLPIVSVGLGNAAVQTTTGASMRAPVQQKMSKLFDQIDTTSSGSISSEQFAKAFQTMNPPPSFKALGSSAVFTKLDPSQTGSVSKASFVASMTALSQSLSNGAAAGATNPASAPSPASGSTGAFINTVV